MVVAGEVPVAGVIAGAVGLELAGGTRDLSAGGAPAAG